ncbi:MAG: FKBP-type peptidyl-prolyl cis-trans isomerase [Elusimicrobia bacterium]|nr:FKBP-type peptidyl-prolyl cis-trans isomerase [Elusimicrobiota bacterium]
MGRGFRLALLLLCAWPCACSRPDRVGRGSVVSLEYLVMVDGKTEDTNQGGEPLRLTVGSGVLPRAAEESLIGMRPGEERSLNVPAAYGERDPKAVSAVPRASFGAMAKDLAPGKVVLGLRDGKPARARVERIDGQSVRLDFNHRLAGKEVYFRLKLLSVARP